MRNSSVRPCPCGSGLESKWQYDARGIELCRTCRRCHRERMAGFRQDVLTDPDYWHDEPIEED
ncbi:hypothetical protein HAP48_0035225 [Bradyrhizobium septentrionale]|uniref:Uncharacterized protein n=1 Tax=Bradyrhizobium septentrionale TaxID=1404411 RepID=A0A973W0H3_9BRAD|nr:hypothetical protein [Bradyrhizobium septentrionale]UGY13787.1 hypothetical protein HAP48_0035225 [Bradyrhizobium septentrionale]